MTNRFMISVAAAALIAGTGFANAQGTGSGREAPSAGSTVQQSAPSVESCGHSAAPTNRDAAEPTKPSPGMKATQSDAEMQPNAAKNQRARTIEGRARRVRNPPRTRNSSKDRRPKTAQDHQGRMKA